MRLKRTTTIYAISIIWGIAATRTAIADLEVKVDDNKACGASSSYNLTMKIPGTAPSSSFTENYKIEIQLPHGFVIANDEMIVKWRGDEMNFRIEEGGRSLFVDDVEMEYGLFVYSLEIGNVGGALQSPFVEKIGKYEMKLVSPGMSFIGSTHLDLERSEGLGMFDRDTVGMGSCLEFDLQHDCSMIKSGSRLMISGQGYGFKSVFGGLAATTCSVEVNGEETENVCLASDDNLRIFDLFKENYENSEIKIKICGLKTPPSTRKFCGFELSLYTQDYQRNPYLQREFCLQVAKAGEFEKLDFEENDFFIKTKFNLTLVTQYKEVLELDNKGVMVVFPREIAKENSENLITYSYNGQEPGGDSQILIDDSHKITIKNLKGAEHPLKIKFMNIRSPSTPLSTTKGVTVIIFDEEIDNQIMHSTTKKLNFTYPMIEVTSIQNSNRKRGQYSDITFNLKLKKFSYFMLHLQELGVNLLDTHKLLCKLPQEYDINMLKDSHTQIESYKEREILVNDFRPDFEGNSTVTIKGVFNPVEYMLTGAFEFELREKEGDNSLVYSTLLEDNQRVRFDKGLFKNVDLGLEYLHQNKSNFVLDVEFELDQMPPRGSSLLLKFSSSLRYVVDFENPCIETKEGKGHSFCSFKVNELKIDNFFDEFSYNQGYLFRVHRLEFLQEVDSSIDVELQIIVNHTDNSFYKAQTGSNLKTNCHSSCLRCYSSNRSICSACNQSQALDTSTGHCRTISPLSALNHLKNLKRHFYIASDLRYLSFGLVFAGILCVMIYSSYMRTIYEEIVIEDNISKNMISWVIALELYLGLFISYYEKKGFMFFIFAGYFGVSFIINLVFAFKFVLVSKRYPSILSCKRSERCLKKYIYFVVAVFFNAGILFKFVQNSEKVMIIMNKPIKTCYGSETSRNLNQEISKKKSKEINGYKTFLFFKSLKAVLVLFNLLTIAVLILTFILLFLKFGNISEFYFEFLLLIFYGFLKFRAAIFKDIAFVKNRIERWKFIQEESNRIEREGHNERVRQVTEHPFTEDFEPDLHTMLEEIKQQMEDEIGKGSCRKERAMSFNELNKIEEVPIRDYIEDMRKEIDDELDGLSLDSTDLGDFDCQS